MRHRKSNQGSAFILVIGVMTTLAMVGTVFFLIAMGDAKMSVARSEAAPMNSVVQGELARIQDALLEDLYIPDTGTDGPYADRTKVSFDWTDPFNPEYVPLWRRYVDYASPQAGTCGINTDPADCADRHLASTELAPEDGVDIDKGNWPQITNLYCYDPDLVKNVDPNMADSRVFKGNSWTSSIDPTISALVDADDDDELDSIPYVDADGDGVIDSILYPTGTFDRNGEQYYAGVRIVDLSAFVNANTAYGLQAPTTAYTIMPTTNVEPEYIYTDTGTLFPLLQYHEARVDSAAATPDWGQFSIEAARRPLNPDISGTGRAYTLYDWSDEFACRQAMVSGSGMDASRLKRAMESGTSGSWDVFGEYLTTFSASRIIPRKTDDSNTTDYEMPETKVEINLPINTPTNRQDAFELYCAAFYNCMPDSDDTERKKKAMQLAVNLIDYRDGDDTPTVYTNGSETVMGVERQPFITRAWYAISWKDDGLGGRIVDTSEMAIVLYNPYESSIDLEDWEVKCGGITEPIPAGETIPADGRYVIRTSTAVLSAVSDTYEFAGLDPQQRVLIVREGTDLDGNPDDVPVGTIDFSELGETIVDPSDATVLTGHFARDYTRANHRYSVAWFKELAAVDYLAVNVPDSPSGEVNDGDSMVGPHTTATVPTFGDMPVLPVFVRGGGNAAFPSRLVSVGELCRLLYVGPVGTSGSEKPLDVVLAEEIHDFPAGLPTPDLRFKGVARLNSMKFEPSDSNYPELPWFCLASDYFVVDSPLRDYDSSLVNGVDNDGDCVPESGTIVVDHNDANVSRAQWNRETVVHGRININTATVETLTALPMLETTLEQRRLYARNLIGYRDRLGVSHLPAGDSLDFQPDRSDATLFGNYLDSGTEELRDAPGFAAAGEPAMLMRFCNMDAPSMYDYSIDPTGGFDGFGSAPTGDLSKAEMRYAYLSNVLAVNSDTYCAYIWIQKGADPKAENLVRRRYVAILDRSNCYEDTDRPQVRALAEVK